MKNKGKRKLTDSSNIDKIEKQEKTIKKKEKIKNKKQNVHLFQMNENKKESTVNEQTESNDKEKNVRAESVEDDTIADIFKKGKLATQKKPSSTKEKQQATRLKQSEKAEEDDDFAQMRGPQKRKKMTEGFHIFTMEELNIGKGGNTDLCPFDCNCCF